jgi:hypothetical protein
MAPYRYEPFTIKFARLMREFNQLSNRNLEVQLAKSLHCFLIQEMPEEIRGSKKMIDKSIEHFTKFHNDHPTKFTKQYCQKTFYAMFKIPLCITPHS